MLRGVPVLFFLTAVAVAPAAAQQSPRGYVDPRPVLEAAAKAIGAGSLKCITFSGAGYTGKVGQNITQDTDWPRGEPLTNYTRTINYDEKSSVEQFSRKPHLNPRSWKYGSGWIGGTPVQERERQTFVVRDNHAWHMDGEGTAPIAAPANAELWQLDIWLNPPGFIKAAMAPGANPKAVWRWEMVESGRDGATTGAIEKVTVVSITVLGKYRVNATINSQNLIQRIETKVPHPVLGDMNYEHEFTEWQTVGGVTFPAAWHHHEGYDDERFKPTTTGGHNAFGGTFLKIAPNSCGAPPAVPDAVRQATVQPERVEITRLADGVWLLGGSSHNSVAVEFRDFVTVVEAPLDEERSLAVIEETVKLAPGKPIRFLVNTHDHFDHIGGLRTYLHIGATIITHKRNRVFYEDELLNYVPRTLQPDMVTLYQPTEIREGYTMETVAENYVISDGTRNMHISYVQPLAHAEGMLMAYLPKEQIVIEADLYDSVPSGGRPAANPAHMSFYRHVKRLGLNVATIAPIHGRPVPWSDFLKAAGEAVAKDAPTGDAGR
jgi:glyoxylase-like metal-dependent hydrolase (beta-lactamase superfamily II)